MNSLANIFVDRALVQVDAGGAVRSHHKASGTDAGEAPAGVDAFPAVARVVPLLAFVHVFAGFPVEE